MTEPTSGDLKGLMAMYNSMCEEPLVPPDRPAKRRGKRSKTGAAKADSPKNSPAKNKKADEKPPSKIIFGRQIRDLSDIKKRGIPPQYARARKPISP